MPVAFSNGREKLSVKDLAMIMITIMIMSLVWT